MCKLCVDIVDPEDAQPIPANRFEKVQRRAEAAGMVVGIYLARRDSMPGEGKRVTLTFVQGGDLDGSIDQQLDVIEGELAYWETR